MERSLLSRRLSARLGLFLKQIVSERHVLDRFSPADVKKANPGSSYFLSSLISGEMLHGTGLNAQARLEPQ